MKSWKKTKSERKEKGLLRKIKASKVFLKKYIGYLKKIKESIKREKSLIKRLKNKLKGVK